MTQNEPEVVRVPCRCGRLLVAVLPARGPNRRRPAMVAWSIRGRPVTHCPQCHRALARISVARFKEQIAGDCEFVARE